MSRYHPLDVRHPSNQRFANPNYLLDPPEALIQAPSRAPASQGRRTATTPGSDQVVSPWGAPSARAQGPVTATTRGQGGSGFLRTGFWLLILAGIVIWQNGYWPAIERWARWTAMDLGLPWPF